MKSKFSKIVTAIAAAVAVSCLCYAVFNLVTIYLEYKKGSDEYSSLNQYVVQDDSDDEVDTRDTESIIEGTQQEISNYTYETELDPISGAVRKQKIYYKQSPVDFESLESINQDLVGWLRLDALDLSYPIVQTDDNDYYLHKTFEGTDNFAGCIFIDHLNDPKFGDSNTIVYGHNMKNGSMFGTLHNLSDRTVYAKDPYFWIYTPDKTYKFHIFSCRTVETGSSTYTIKFSTKDDYLEYLKDAANASEVICDSMTLDASDKIVTLSTCTGNEATRFVVQGKLVRTYKTIK